MGGNDKLYGKAGNDKLYGGTDSDALAGDSGNDRLYGDSGKDRLNGSSGNDTLTGGSDADSFRFTTALGAGNVDTIASYSVADDAIQIDNAVFTGLAAGALAAGAFRTGTAAADADDRIIYNSATGTLLFESVAGSLPARLQVRAQSAGKPGRFMLRYYVLDVLPA